MNKLRISAASSRARLRHPFVLVALALVTCRAAAAEPIGTYADWQRHRDAVLKDPALVRWYSFDGATDSSAEIPDAAAKSGPLHYRPTPATGKAAEVLHVVPGRWPAKKAVRLDAGCLVGGLQGIKAGPFTVELWCRINAPGTLPGNNGAVNGTLMALGGGYWDGWRITCDPNAQLLRFEIGQAKPSHAVGFIANPVPSVGWHHVATAWDGQRMRIYVDGIAMATGEFKGGMVLPDAKDSLRIGYAGNGVGSVNLDVDEVAIFDRGLTADEVLRHACFEAALPNEVAAHFRAADEAALQSQTEVALRELTAAAQSPGLAAPFAAAARLQLASALRAKGQQAQAAECVAQILELPNLREPYRRLAEAMAVRTLHDAPGALGPASLRAVMALPGVSEIERLSARLSLGHAQLAAGDATAARAEYEAVAAAAEAPPPLRAIAQIHVAEALRIQNNAAGAKAAYAKVLTMADVPPTQRWEAEQRLAEIEKKPTAPAIPARLPLPRPAVTFYVAPGGADSNNGTERSPFATMERARDAIRQIKQGGKFPAGGVVVCVRGGTYRVAQTFKLDTKDSGNETSPIVYRAAEGEHPVFTGGVRLTQFKPVTDAAILARLPEEARGKVLQVDIKAAGVTDVLPLRLGGYASGSGFKTWPARELFFDGQAMRPARWPNEGYVHIEDICVKDDHKIHNQVGSKTGKFIYSGDRPSRWANEPDGLLYGYWFWDWADSYDHIAAIDPASHAITLAEPFHRYGYRKGQRYYAVNLLSELDVSGEWYLDRNAGIAYLYPPSDVGKADVEISALAQPFVQIDGAAHVTLQGLTWEYGCADGVAIRGGEHCTLAGCTIRHLAGDGAIIAGGKSHGLLACDIYSMGRGGAVVSGGERKTLTPGNHSVENCHIHHLSRIDHTYTPAILMSGVGNRIVHNLLHDVNSSAIRLGGNDHLVELNEVYRTVMESDDQGGVDMFGDPTFRGNVFRWNYWHHCGNWDQRYGDLPAGQAGIRFDDAICGQTVYGNVFYHCSAGQHGFGGVQIHGGKDNVVDSNLFVDCAAGISFSPWGEARWREYVPKWMLQREVDPNLYVQRYPALARLAEGQDVNLICRNLFLRCSEAFRRERGRNQLYDNATTSQDPGFLDGEHGNFALKSGGAGPVGRSGLRPIPFAAIGLYRDSLRPTLPEELIRAAREAGK